MTVSRAVSRSNLRAKAYPFLLFHFASSKPLSSLASSSAVAAAPATTIPTRSHHQLLPLFVRGGGPGTTREMSTRSTRSKTDEIGGGAINEKERLYMKVERRTDEIVSPPNDDDHIATSTFDPNSLCHSLHATVGMDRYPNYLSRWPLDEMDQLEASLERQLREVRQQRQATRQRRGGIALLLKKLIQEEKGKDKDGNVDLLSLLEPPTSWEDIRDNILDPNAGDAIFKSKVFRGVFKKDSNTNTKRSTIPSVEDVLSGRISLQLDPAQLEQWMEQEMFDVYSFPLLSKAFCDKVRNLIRMIVSLGEQEFQHLNLGRRPVDLDTVGLYWINNLLFHLIIRPLSQHLFAETEQFQDLDWRQGYIAGYSVSPSAPAATPRQRLVSHTDDSEVTLNIGLGDEFEGGALQFRGLRGTNEEGELLGDFKPQLGTALLHAGRHLHEVTPVTSGDRYAFIIWARSWNSLRANTCPCCWLNRRQDLTCICGPRWN